MATIMNENERFHLKIKKGDVGRYVILPGDPGRVPKIAEYLDDAVQVAQNREYNIYTGKLLGEKVSVCSTGIGGPSAAIAVEELIDSGATTFIRVGTCGGVDLQVSGGDLIIAEAAIRAEGTSYEYLPQGYPALADFEVTSALAQAAKEIYENKNVFGNYHVGVVHSKDSFYGEVNPEGSAVGDNIKSRWDSYLKSGCLASEMECAAIYSVGLVRGARHETRRIRCGAVLTALWNAERSKRGLDDTICNDTTRGIKCAVRALEIIIANDAEQEARYRAYMNENR
ncbi:MAG: nucleoside phosphorylase [Oscillospiraceae bacterium]|nr:nucleoside phosphorylase [Oscillospiraceae bacterium]